MKRTWRMSRQEQIQTLDPPAMSRRKPVLLEPTSLQPHWGPPPRPSPPPLKLPLPCFLDPLPLVQCMFNIFWIILPCNSLEQKTSTDSNGIKKGFPMALKTSLFATNTVPPEMLSPRNVFTKMRLHGFFRGVSCDFGMDCSSVYCPSSDFLSSCSSLFRRKFQENWYSEDRLAMRA